VACECDRWLEIWNLVFMQFERKEKDSPLEPLPRPSIDTGAGLERMTVVAQGKRSNYDTDLFVPLLARATALSGRAYGRDSADDASMRVIADHARATAFLVSDGVQPSNEGRGYVLRRIMRRAIRHGSRLGLDEPFLHQVVKVVVQQMRDAYPELQENEAFVLEATRHEEEAFRRTLARGLRLIDEEMARAKGQKVLSGDVVFLLHDTHGFPWDLTQIIARERGFDVDLDRYQELMEAQRQRGTFGGSGEKAVADLWPALQARLEETVFLGYEGEGHEGEGTIVALVKDGHEVPQLRAGDRGDLLSDRTPFYGESGGQVGDTGRIVGHGGKAEAQVLDAKRPVPGLVVHEVHVTSGTLRVGDMVQLSVDGQRRNAIRANHSATHLLHRALNVVLGEHVKQAGSVVAPDYLRFDYSHFSPPTTEQLEQVEDLVNGWILDNADAQTQVMALDEAKKAGAVALFGEKYGERVRVVSVHPQSTELCGGTHVRRTGDIGLFKITSEGGIASGVRRIVALTGLGAMAWVRELEHEVRRAAELLRTSPKELARRVEATQKRVKELEKEVETAARRASAASSKDVLSEAREVNGVKVLAHRVDPADAKAYRALADQFRDKLQSGVVVVWGEKDGKGLVLVGATTGHRRPRVQRRRRHPGGGQGGRRLGGGSQIWPRPGADPALLGAAVEKLVASVRA
jgi:alanyl-tRNA synthetase